MRAQEVEDEAREMDGERGLSVLHVDLDSLLHEYNTPRFRIVHMKGQQYTAQNRLGRFSILPSCRPLTSAQLMFPFLTCAGNLTNCIPLCVLSTDRAGRDGRGRERLRDDCVEERDRKNDVGLYFRKRHWKLNILFVEHQHGVLLLDEHGLVKTLDRMTL
ncbi:hypothetical protein BLNAU_24885 [Blattamonas nauphoetae]|uniref:Uncharacterized protein n=1 Tax=Blattamonas nauphoetae TaxID=2049346 RepID=A0ABQ9WL67_9EUKA|nr:hypothetical protein BLNAU_24885 [Blattamonas nauphoetae]